MPKVLGDTIRGAKPRLNRLADYCLVVSWDDADEDPNMRAWRESNLGEVGMRLSVEPEDVYRALTDYIIGTEFTCAQWERLADDIGKRDGSIIRTHDRLLRGRDFWNPDYEPVARAVIEDILGRKLEHLDEFVAAMPDLGEWLKSNDQRRHGRLFGDSRPIVPSLLTAAELTTSGIREAVQKLRDLSPDASP